MTKKLKLKGWLPIWEVRRIKALSRKDLLWEYLLTREAQCATGRYELEWAREICARKLRRAKKS